MKFVDHIRFRIRQALPAALILVAFGYITYHALEGNHGLFKLQQVNVEMAELKGVAAEVEDEKEALEKKVANLRRDNLDLDLLDERARAVLGFKEPGEIVIYREADSE